MNCWGYVIHVTHNWRQAHATPPTSNGSRDVFEHVTIWFAICHFLLVVHWIRASISSCFWDILPKHINEHTHTDTHQQTRPIAIPPRRGNSRIYTVFNVTDSRTVCVVFCFLQGTPQYLVFFSPSIVRFSQHVLLEAGCLQPNTRVGCCFSVHHIAALSSVFVLTAVFHLAFETNFPSSFFH